MRRFLLAVFSLFSLHFANAQVLFNEFYTSPASGSVEFFELYNIGSAPVPLDCYSLVVFYNTEGKSDPIKRGFYVLDLPNKSIPSRGYFVGAAGGPTSFVVQGCSRSNANINWNDLAAGGNTGATLKNYEYSPNAPLPGGGTGPGYIVTSLSSTTLLDFFYENKDQTQINDNEGVRYAMFLFNGNNDLVNSFLGGSKATGLPASILNLPPLKFENGCSNPKSIIWSSLANAENVIETTGAPNSENGFIRINDGKCGDWEKSSNPANTCTPPLGDAKRGEHTPGWRNGPGSNYKVVFTLSTEVTLCNSRIDFAITGYTNSAPNAVVLPIQVDIYREETNVDGKLDVTDVFIKSITINQIPTDYILVDELFGGFESKYILVFRTAQGCVDKIVPVQQPTLTVTERNACNSNVIVTWSGANFKTTQDLFPMTISLYLDKPEAGPDGDIGTSDDIYGTYNNEDESDLLPGTGNDPISVTQINDFTNAATPFVIPQDLRGQPLLLVYRTANDCIIRAAVPTEISCSPLPVNLNSFTAIRNQKKVFLKWETLTEQNNRGFYVQRNVKGVWENRAFVFSAADGGNSNKSLEYFFNDDNIEKGVSQYRIQQVDMDNKVTYSPIRSVKGDGQVAKTVVYPNPSDIGKVNVVFENEGSRNVTVSDMNGRIVRQYRSVVNSLVIDNLDAGMYILQITDLSTAETSVEKVVIKKR